MIAGSKTVIKLPEIIFARQSQLELVLTVSLQLSNTTKWAEHGHEIAWTQHKFSSGEFVPAPLPAIASIPLISGNNHTLTIATAKSTFQFSRSRGLLRSWTTNSGPVLSGFGQHKDILIPCFWRPPTDNDRPKALPHWKAFRVDQIVSQLRHMVLDKSDPAGVLNLTTRTYIAPPSLGWGWHATTTYQIQPDGSAMSVFISMENPIGVVPEHLPRIGFDLFLASRLNHVKWCGRGPGESYPDKKNSQRLGIWEVDDISQLHTPYEVPQENGNHVDTRWVELSSRNPSLAMRVIRICSPFPLAETTNGSIHHAMHQKETRTANVFNFTATRYLAETIERAAHTYDLIEEKFGLLRLDAAVCGVGTAAVGPGPREDHLVKPSKASFGFMFTLT